ncbi:helix-turn-helix transcriptional regulator [Streptosporangiaceae bacterium NEAU-GS5]|nr:helix-turn-helix transcriptional regulator [Streptosporangiaceae bacterium NEAU-GS5]
MTPRSVQPAPTGAATRRRDAANTRRLLLEAARQRFAYDGYAATTVRDIADDAGVNVALINRYFSSKEGLFAACLEGVEEELRRTGGTPLGEVPDAIAGQLAGSAGDATKQILLLLLRSSGDERVDQIRLGVLRAYAERLASAAGWRPGEPDEAQLLLRAQLILCASAGIVILRASGLQPLASASGADLTPPLRDLVDAMLSAERK